MKLLLNLCLLLFLGICTAQPNITKWNTEAGYDFGSTLFYVSTRGSFDYYYEKANDSSVNGSGSKTNTGYETTYITVPTPGIYYLYITPTSTFKFETGFEQKLIELIQWGDVNWHPDLSNMFAACDNLIVTATDIPDFSNVTKMTGMFRYCSALTNIPNMSNWDVSNVTDMSFMFFFSPSFSEDMDGWDVSNVTDFRGMFDGANSFNGSIGSWDTSSATNISGMFKNAWNFNQDLSQWNTSLVTTMKATFQYAKKFESDLSSWDVSNVTNMSYMFDGAEKFESKIDHWDVSQVTTMQAMFKHAKKFGGDISGWDVSKVTIMQSMFHSTLNFNIDISGWDTGKVQTTYKMFNNAAAFDRSLGSLHLPHLYNAQLMFSNSGLSCINYNSTLKGWANQYNMPSYISLGANNIKYGTEGQSYRNQLISQKSWSFIGDSYTPDCTLSLDKVNNDSKVFVYPNPASEILNIELSDNFGFKEAEIYDLTGKIVMTTDSTQINVDSLPVGIYILKILFKDESPKIMKFVKK